MGKIKILLSVLIISALGLTAAGQASSKQVSATKTETFKVLGKCDMCKTRIEKTVKVDGVTSANWDTKSEMLTVVYNPSKTSIDALSKMLALVGHDTEKYKATDEAYAKLPECCHYDRAK